jgi:ubiquinone/menaquinone biosynthesis C-methylase UbiE
MNISLVCGALLMSEMSNRTKVFYDVEAASYDQSRYESKSGQRMNRFHQHVLEEILSVGCFKKDNVLELGCGTGRLLPFVAGMAGAVTGIDMSLSMLEVALRRKNETSLNNIQVLQGNALDMPFPDNHFDMVYSILMINLIPDYTRAFCEVRRVLKDGGVFLFSVPNIESIYFPAGFIVNRRGKAFGSNSSGYRYSHWFTSGEVRSALHEANFILETELGQPPWTTIVDDAPPLPGTFLGRIFSKSLYIRATAV